MKVSCLALWFALGACSGAVLAPATAWADERPGHARRVEERRAKRAERERRPRRDARDRAARRKDRAARRVAARREQPVRAAAPPTARAAAAGGSDEIVREGDTSVKVMRFSGLDIEGRLKSPQLLVFVERVRAEFERPALPHRSFMPELRDSAAREPLR